VLKNASSAWGVIFDGGLIIVKNVSRRDAFQVGGKPVEEIADLLQPHLRSAPFDIAGLFNLNPVAPPALKITNPVITRPGVLPLRVDVFFHSVGLDKILKIPLFHWKLKFRAHLKALHKDLLHILAELVAPPQWRMAVGFFSRSLRVVHRTVFIFTSFVKLLAAEKLKSSSLTRQMASTMSCSIYFSLCMTFSHFLRFLTGVDTTGQPLFAFLAAFFSPW
jgi:hypothetical protein